MTGLLPLIAAIAMAIFAVRLGKAVDARAGGRRGAAVRICSAALGLAILIALGCGTWREAFGPMATATSPLLRLPTLPAPALPDHECDIASARVLVHAVILRGDFPIRAEEFDVRLPADSGRTWQRSGSVDGYSYGMSLVLTQLSVGRVAAEQLHLECQSMLEVELRSANASGSSGSSLEIGKAQDLVSEPGYRPGSPWSLMHRQSARVRIVARAQLVAAGDPLRSASIVEIGQEVADAQEPARARGGSVPARNPLESPAFNFIGSSGPAGLLAVAAAALLAQLFRRRLLAFAGTLALSLVACATIDHAVIGHAAAMAADPTRSDEERVRAAETLTGTFFFRRAGYGIASGVAADGSTPVEVRAAAAGAAAELGSLLVPGMDHGRDR